MTSSAPRPPRASLARDLSTTTPMCSVLLGWLFFLDWLFVIGLLYRFLSRFLHFFFDLRRLFLLDRLLTYLFCFSRWLLLDWSLVCDLFFLGGKHLICLFEHAFWLYSNRFSFCSFRFFDDFIFFGLV